MKELAGFKQLVAKPVRKLIKQLASLRIAVLVIISLAILIAIGTIVESQYNAEIANKLVYKTPWMIVVMSVLAINLLAVMADRWPWKWRHAPFICAHIGIILLLIGSWVSMQWGIDGNMRVGIGEKARLVSLTETEFVVYASFDGSRYSKVYEMPLDFFKNPPTPENPVKVSLFNEELVINGYKPFVIPNKIIQESPSQQAGSAARIQISGTPPGAPRPIMMTEWLLQNRPGKEAAVELGPARVVLAKENRNFSGNTLWLEPVPGKTELKYHIFNSKNSSVKTGVIREGDTIQTGWMNFEFKLLRFLPRAQEVWDFKELKRPTEVSSQAVAIEFRGQTYWIPMNDILKLFTENSAYLVTYGNRRIDLGFDLHLQKFHVGRYQGTMKASSYESEVVTPDGQTHVISMNEPLLREGLRFYQASFQEDEQGKPTASIFSVNYDPGRTLKYLGSLIISIGVVWLFVNRARLRRKNIAGSAT